VEASLNAEGSGRAEQRVFFKLKKNILSLAFFRKIFHQAI
jgi:hypothetical protein